MQNNTDNHSADVFQDSVEFSLLTPARMLWNRRWLVVAIWAAVSAISFLVVHHLPAVYQAEALVLVDPQKIPESMVSSTVKEDIVDRLALISQEIMSRTRLIKIIQDFDLYKEERKRLTQEEVVDKMRQDITVKVQKNWAGGRMASAVPAGRMAAFLLGYEGNNPAVVTKVTNQLAGLYVSENIRSRENQAEGTVEFIDEQLEDAKRSLDVQEAKVSEFKLHHNGELPQQETSLLAAVNGLQVQLQGTQDALNRATDEKMTVATALSSAEMSEAAFERSLQPRAKTGAVMVTESGAPSKTRVEILEGKLHDLQLRYTPDHPDVQAVQREIAEAKRQEEQEGQVARVAPKPDQSATAGPSQATTVSSSRTDLEIVTPELLRERERVAILRSQLASLKHTIELRTKQREEIIGQIASYQSRINSLPLVEQQMAALTRDYQISQGNYKSLLDKKLAAGLATDMEHSEKSERFKIIDAARYPEKPIKPNRILLASICSLVGLVLGLGVGLGLEFRLGKLMGDWELPKDVVVLGRVPIIAMPSTRDTPRGALSALLFVFSTPLLHSVYALWARGGR